MEDDEQDVYVAQLHEVFDSCDRVGKGFLDRSELIELCKKLQLDDQIPQLLQQLLGSEQAEGQVTFEDFKEGFVAVLSLAIDNLSSSEDEGDDTVDNAEPPKLVKNEKRYGRKSKPDHSYSEDLYSGDDESVISSRPESRANTTALTNGISDSHDEEVHTKERGKLRRRISSRKSSLRNSIRRHNSMRWQKKPSIEKTISQDEIEVLEASGEMRSTQSPVSVNSGYASPEPSEEDQLKAIWNEVHVGANGFLDRHELALVCEHIGMDSMNDQEITLLFEELDEDGDGKVSFDEFLNGLFAAKDHYNSQEVIEEEFTELQQSTPYSKPPGGGLTSTARLKNTSRGDDLFLSRTGASSGYDLLSILDPDNTGFAKFEDVRDLWSAQGHDDALQILQHVEVDADGRVNLQQLTNLLETVIHEQGDGLSNAVLGIYKHEVVFLRSHLDQLTNERDALKDNIVKMTDEKEMLIKESEDATRHLERLHEGRLRETENSFLDKMQTLQQNMSEERNKDLLNASHQRSMLEDSLQMTKGEEVRLRQKLADAEEEILRLEKALAESQDKLNEADVTRDRLEKELDSMSDLSGRLADLEKQQLLKQQQNRNANKGVRELERINRELRDENDELRLQVEGLVNQVNTSVKRRPSHRKRQSGEKGVHRMGSVLSDYTKPTVIRRKKDGGSSEEESEEEDQVDGENDAEMKNNLETIKKLEAELKDKDASISEMEITAQHDRRALEAKIKELSDEISEHENSIKEKDINIQNLKNEIETLRSSHDKEDDTQKRYETELANLTSQFSGEMEELQQSMVHEKEQLEQEYQKKMKNMEKSFSSEKKRMSDELEGNFSQMKEMLINEYESEKSEMEQEHQGEKAMLESYYRGEIESSKEKFDEEKTKLIEKIQILEEEKSEAELKFLNEKAAMEQQFRIDKAELELSSSSSKAEFNKSQRDWANLRVELEKGHKEQIQALENEFKRERSKREEDHDNLVWELKQDHAKEVAGLKQNYEQSKAELEQKFSRQKAEMRESFTREKNELMQKFERELAEQREALEKEFCQNLSEQEAELRKGFFRENSEMEKNLREEKYRLEEEHQEKIAESEKSFQKWKSEIEEHFTEEKAKIIQNAAREKSEIENKYKDEIAVLRQAFSNGEAGLKGQLKEDFYEMLAKHKAELEKNYAKSKAQLEESFFREKAELQRSSLVESSEVRDSYTREKAELEESYKKKIRELQDSFDKKKNEIENERLKEKEQMRAELEAEFSFRMKTDHEDLEETVKHLQGEINYLKEQKKELETKVQTLELKTIGRESLDVKVAREKIADLERKLEALTKEKSKLQKDNNEYKIKVDEIQRENEELTESALEKQMKLSKMEETKSELASLERRLEDVNKKKLLLERQMQEKNSESRELYEEVCLLKDKIEKIESSYRREIDIERQKVMVATTELETAKSKHQRDIAELRDQLHRANISSERDQALREKVFNEAKAEVMSLNKKLEEKTRRVRELENASQMWEKRINDLETQKMAMAMKVKEARESLDEHVARLSKQLQHSEMRNTRSDTLVHELYIENAKLTKALQQTEANEKKAEKNLRQLMEQKRALQRVISKLCGANAIA